MLQPGDYVGRYEIQAVVGEGGFGKVYRAWDAELERPVAIKALSSERRASAPDQHAAYLERFKMERRVQGQFQHPHIVSVYDMVRQNGDEYLVEEYVAGGTLRALIEREGRLPPERVVQIGTEMCRAITAAWEWTRQAERFWRGPDQPDEPAHPVRQPSPRHAGLHVTGAGKRLWLPGRAL
jgi:serine/threonine protein kinase